MLSCSTCWNSDRHTDGRAMLEEILELGFDRVELGHGIRLSLMEGIQELYNEGAVTFTSLHNFCPLPIEITHSSPDCYQFSSFRESERDRAMKLTFQTIDFAERLGAPFVVMHLGRVTMMRVSDTLAELVESGQLLSRDFVKLKLKAIKTREARAPQYMARVKECLERAAEYAASKNIHLGVESRQSYEEIPSESELPDLLAGINSPYVGYWHDFGHVQIKENLTLLDHYEWLSKIRGRLLGCHLHDVEWPAHDHRAPFSGHVNYDKLIPLLPKSCLFVWEMSPRRKPDEIKESLRKWKDRFGSGN